MKKTYNNPNIKIVKIQTSGMLAGSVTFDGKGGGKITVNGDNATGDAMGRDFDFDDEDEY